jgi:hypothetical protein
MAAGVAPTAAPSDAAMVAALPLALPGMWRCALPAPPPTTLLLLPRDLLSIMSARKACTRCGLRTCAERE